MKKTISSLAPLVIGAGLLATALWLFLAFPTVARAAFGGVGGVGGVGGSGGGPSRGAKAGRSTAAEGASLSLQDAASDIEQRLARWRRVEMPWDPSRLSSRERQLVEKLVTACRHLEGIYWRQSDPEALALYRSLAGAKGSRAQALRRLLFVHGSRWDLIDQDRPFVGTLPMPPGRFLYPQAVTRAMVELYAADHPDEKAAIYDERTVLRRTASGGYEAVPYHEAYRDELEPAAAALRAAAGFSDDPAFANFLRLRADALLSDDYYPSDVAWVDLVNPKFDLIFAPYETYLDGLLGVKTSYGAAVLVRNEPESAKLAVFQKYVPDIQDALPLPPEDRPSKHGRAAPMEVMDAPYRAGDLRHGYQAVADNLPNDPRIHEQRGSKRIFFKNFMDARVRYVVLPIAKRLMRADQGAKATADGYLAAVMLHEISHGLGPAFARRNGKQVDIREAIGPVFSALEEAKADVTGMFGLAWLVDHGALPKERLEEYYSSYVGGIFRTVRFGVAEAHGRAEMMEFNYLSAEKAIVRDAAAGRYAIDLAKIRGALASLARELLETEAAGDRGRAEAWFKRYDRMPPELKALLDTTRDVPIDLDPEGAIPDEVR